MKASSQVYPHNFSPGPGAIPASVLDHACEAMRLVPEMGLPLLGISHRTVGGLRVSLYNAVTLSSAKVLASFLRDFYRRCA